MSRNQRLHDILRQASLPSSERLKLLLEDTTEYYPDLPTPALIDIFRNLNAHRQWFYENYYRLYNLDSTAHFLVNSWYDDTVLLEIFYQITSLQTPPRQLYALYIYNLIRNIRVFSIEGKCPFEQYRPIYSQWV